MKPKQEFTSSCFPALCWDTPNSWEFTLISCAVAVLAVTCLGCGAASGELGPERQSNADLPEISGFLTKPSDRFLVDIKEVSRGHPFLGKGQQVRKGDRIAYLYTPPNVDGCHIHFHLMVHGRNGFLAPAIFDQKIVKDFHTQCDGFRWSNGGNAIPPCMGYRIGAKENPFDTGAKDEL